MPRKRKPPESECEIPHRVDPSIIDQLLLGQPAREAESIREYVEWQAKEPVLHLEKLKTEYAFSNRYDAWDVTTNGDRYWVISNPTNLYSQQYFPSLDYTITFHIGLAARIFAHSQDARTEERDRLLPALRKLAQASDGMDRADEAEEFQAVGMRCREALLELVQAARQNPAIAATPAAAQLKAADFTAWADVLADRIASGPSAKEARGYLKAVARGAWQLVSWLTHAKNAFRRDAQLALGATEATLNAYAAALIRFEEAPPERCPQCSSYRTVREFIPGRARAGRYITVCEVCGWSETQKPQRKRAAKRPGA